MKHYIITTFDHNEHKKFYYHTKGPISSEEINQYMGAFSFLINRDSKAGIEYLYVIGLDNIVYRIRIDDIISIQVKEGEEND